MLLSSSSTGGIAIGVSDAVSCVPGAGSGSIAPSLSDDMTVECDAEAFLEAVRVALQQDNQPEKQVQFMDLMMAFQGNMCVSDSPSTRRPSDASACAAREGRAPSENYISSPRGRIGTGFGPASRRSRGARGRCTKPHL